MTKQQLTDNQRIKLAEMLGFRFDDKLYPNIDLIKRKDSVNNICLSLRAFNPHKIEGAKYLRDLYNLLDEDEDEEDIVFEIAYDLIKHSMHRAPAMTSMTILLNYQYFLCLAILKVKGE